MLANLGFSALAITFFVSLYGIGASLYGLRRNQLTWIQSARNAMLLTFPLLTISVLSIVFLLIGDHFEVEYIATVSSRSMPLYLKATALWGGQAGSLVFWSWTMSAFASAVTLRKWDQDQELLPWVIIVCLITLAFFLGMSLTVENPFARLWLEPSGQISASLLKPENATPFIPQDGQGLNPLLRHPGMIFHPPTLYLGFVAFVIPYAFAIAALITRHTDDSWIRATRRWTLWAWLFLSLGLVLGARWAYDVLGWGGYWGWDPVEISAFLPWLTGTAFLHSVVIQEKRGMFKRWNMVLIILTYSLVIFGTFLTRSGVLSSVHAFAQSAVGPLFFAFIGITLSLSLWLLLSRWDDLEAKEQMTSMLSRESLFLFNNLLFMGILIVCFWGVIFPLISELVTGQKVTVGPPFYERANAPLMAALLLLMGVAPLSAWGRSTFKTLGRAVWKPTIAAVRRCHRRHPGRHPQSRRADRLLPGCAGHCRHPAGILARGPRSGQTPRRKPLRGDLEVDQAKPPPLRRLPDPPEHGHDGDRHHRHRALPKRDSGHVEPRRVLIVGGLHDHVPIAERCRHQRRS